MSVYAVAGVSGRVGSVVAGELLGQGAGVRVLLRNAQQASRWSMRGAETAIGSLDDAAYLTQALSGVSGFFVLLPENPSAQDFHGDRRRMADAIAGSVQRSGVPHVVFLSAVAAVLPEGNGPASDLHYLENALRSTGTTLTTLRAAWLQENIGMAIEPALQAGIYPNFLPNADQPFPTIATRDVGRIAAAALQGGADAHEIVDLVGPMYSIRQLADALGTALEKHLHIVDIPAAGHVAALTQAGLSASFAEAVAELYACFASGRIRPQGDRASAGTTTIADVLRNLLAPASTA